MLSDNLIRLRTKKGLSQNKLAEISGITQRTISYIEDKSQENPTLNTLERLSKSLDTTIEELIK